MRSRSRILTTALWLCHLLLLPPLVTSQLLPEGVGPSPSVVGQRPSTDAGHLPQEHPADDRRPTTDSQQPRFAAPDQPGEDVLIEARQQEKRGDLYTLRGDVAITYRQFVLRADQMTYNAATGAVTATGHIIFDGGPHDEHLEASRAEYNVKTEEGRFHDVIGTTGARFHGKHVVLTSSNPFYFRGNLVEKYGPNRLVVHRGVVTSCRLPNPKWTFNAERITVDVGDQARIYHSTFRLFHIPILYFPYAQHPVDKLGRQTGFLIPTIGQSSRKGTILGEGVYWAINRSLDATVAAEYYSRRGWAQHGEFRARPSQDSYLNATYFGVLDRGFGQPRVDQGGQDIRLNAEKTRLPLGFRGVADVDYLSSFVFRLAFAETFSLAVNSEVRSTAFLSRARDGFFFNAVGSRYQNFQSTTRGDLITILRAPSFNTAGVDRKLGRTPFYWSYDVAAEGVSRREPDFVTASLVGRFDVRPTVALPLVFHGWSLRPEVGLRDTFYSQRRDPLAGKPGIGAPVDDAINRRALETSVELRPPALSRIFQRRLGEYTLKHTIEPRVTYRFVEGVNNFPEMIRFDYRDVLSDTNEVEYALVNRLYAKGSRSTECTDETSSAFPPKPVPEAGSQRPATGGQRPATSDLPAGASATPSPAESACRPGPPVAREIVTWEIKQKYFIDPEFGGALVAGRRNVFTTTADFTGIAFLTEPRKFSPLVSRVRVRAGALTDGEWQIDYDTKKGRINASTALVNRRFGDVFVAGSHAFLKAPGEVFVSQPIAGPTEFNQLRWLMGYGHPNKRGVNTAANIGFDIHSGFLQYSAFQTSYNWDCCGLSFEYRRFALGSVRNENQFRFALSLTNVGTFGTLRRQERLF